MRTLRFDFHIGRLEWVTCQVSVSHSTVGRVKADGAVALENVGGRMMMFAMVRVVLLVLILWVDGQGGPRRTGTEGIPI